jgi:YidC/Oxa1 family membrane protein insertase
VNVDANGNLDPDNVIPPDSDLAEALLAGDNGFLGMNLSLSPADAVAIDWVDAIPYLVLILVVIASGFYQQYQTTRRRDGQPEQTQQAQSMQTAMKIMPLVFGFISWGFPAGLVLYFATSNIFRIGQQAMIVRMDESHEGGGSEGEKDEGRGGKGPEDEPPAKRKGPSPNASKKRKGRRRK